MEEIYVVEIVVRGTVVAKDKSEAARTVLQNCFEMVPLPTILSHKVVMKADKAEDVTDIMNELPIVNPNIE
jgi:hypothetical protein